MEQLKLVIVGNVDHGKSTLIGRLLYDTGSLPEAKLQEIEKTSKELGKDLEFAFVMDHLQEEREQAMTIDTAQTFFQTNKRKYVVIDAPGHVELIKNMITGASQADASILIIDAEEGVGAQTKRHAVILNLLGMKDIIVVINKMDIVGYDKQKFEALKIQITEFLKSLDIVPKYVIPISATKGDFVSEYTENLSWYDGPSVIDALDSLETPKSDEDKPLMYPVQDVYDGKLFVGRVESGRMSKNDSILVLPVNVKTKIAEIKVFLGEKTEASTGECIALKTSDALSIVRGDVICHENSQPAVATSFKAHIFWISPERFQKGDQLVFKCSTQETLCSIGEIERRFDSSTLEVLQSNAESLNETEVGDVVIKTQNPMCITNFSEIPELGRFVLERKGDIVAGGIVTRASKGI